MTFVVQHDESERDEASDVDNMNDGDDIDEGGSENGSSDAESKQTGGEISTRTTRSSKLSPADGGATQPIRKVKQPTKQYKVKSQEQSEKFAKVNHDHEGGEHMQDDNALVSLQASGQFEVHEGEVSTCLIDMQPFL